jgi:hypothetical protein
MEITTVAVVVMTAVTIENVIVVVIKTVIALKDMKNQSTAIQMQTRQTMKKTGVQGAEQIAVLDMVTKIRVQSLSIKRLT